jgi:DNA-binding GntR family transcriptional regulator
MTATATASAANRASGQLKRFCARGTLPGFSRDILINLIGLELSRPASSRIVYGDTLIVYNTEMRSALQSPERQAGGHDRIYEILLREIVEGGLAPGTRLVEGRLAERLGVSRTPLREALFRLHQEGFVLTSAGRGFSVKPLDDKEARELFPILSALEGLALSMAGPLLALDVEALREANRALAPLSRRPLAAIDADTAFHELLLRRCPNASLLEMIAGVRRRLLR